jgi:hypothetical protein
VFRVIFQNGELEVTFENGVLEVKFQKCVEGNICVKEKITGVRKYFLINRKDVIRLNN